jgi:hypothetical protein
MKINEVLNQLSKIVEMEPRYGDLPVVIVVHHDKDPGYCSAGGVSWNQKGNAYVALHISASSVTKEQ